MSVRFAVRIASIASCFALLKPTKGVFLGSQRKTMLVFGWDSRMRLNLWRSQMDSFWSSCGDAFRALSIAAPEGSVSVTKFEGRVVRLSRKWVSASRPEWRARKRVSDSVTVSLSTFSV